MWKDLVSNKTKSTKDEAAVPVKVAVIGIAVDSIYIHININIDPVHRNDNKGKETATTNVTDATTAELLLGATKISGKHSDMAVWHSVAASPYS